VGKGKIFMHKVAGTVVGRMEVVIAMIILMWAREV
jgi:hypothetical protein